MMNFLSYFSILTVAPSAAQFQLRVVGIPDCMEWIVSNDHMSNYM